MIVWYDQLAISEAPESDPPSSGVSPAKLATEDGIDDEASDVVRLRIGRATVHE